MNDVRMTRSSFSRAQDPRFPAAVVAARLSERIRAMLSTSRPERAAPIGAARSNLIPHARRSRLSDLSTARQRFVAVLARVRFGRIEDLHVHRGEPAFNPAPRVITRVKFAGADAVPAMTTRGVVAADYVLKAEVLQLLDEMRAVG